MARIRSIVLKVNDIPRAAAFWTRALGYEASPADPAFLVPPDGDGPRLHLDADDRTHLDLWAASAAEQQAEVERLVALGAVQVDWDYPEDADFVVLADPEGNLFCVVNTAA
ncbi:VOC family protein [Catellatospora vulcania]|uniref:VOC family protein n=1 Tax=Catellatospora vulcania TaxID=1460450 RepID=UPI0012D45F1B|nr:VOC family protein [Catellatospora vulcania]